WPGAAGGKNGGGGGLDGAECSYRPPAIYLDRTVPFDSPRVGQDDVLAPTPSSVRFGAGGGVRGGSRRGPRMTRARIAGRNRAVGGSTRWTTRMNVSNTT